MQQPTMPPPPQAKRMPGWLPIALAVVITAVVVGVLSNIGHDDTAVAAPPSPLAASPAPVVTPTPPAYTPPPVPAVARGDARACELIRQAATREPNSNSWIDMLSDAQYKAVDYDLMDAIDKAYWTTGKTLAYERTQGLVQMCEHLGA